MGAITRNFTPFEILGFESRAHRGAPYHVVAVKATFSLANGKPLTPVPAQRPFVLADEYYGDPCHSSIRFESDLSPFKPRGEVHVVGAAKAPRDQWLTEWPVRIRVGGVDHRLRVTGPRDWAFSVVHGWVISNPEPCGEVPLRYEYAFGGNIGEGADARVYEENPVGRGFTAGRTVNTTAPIPAPQIEHEGRKIARLNGSYTPAGTGPLARWWKPRLALAGTFDDQWLKTRWPDIPDDYDFAHHNSAPAGLQAPGYFQPGDPIELDGLDASGPVRSSIPPYLLFCLVRFENGVIAPTRMNLDTVILDLEPRQAMLIWRCRVPLHLGVRVMEARMSGGARG